MKQMKVVDFSVYKIYLVCVGILVTILFPQVMQIHPLLLGIPAILMMIYMIPKTFKGSKKAHGLIETVLHNTHKRKTIDVSIFKLLMVMVGILSVYFFPILATVDPLIYGGIVLFGAGWMLSILAR